MDWSKVKNVLLALFAALNVFLLFNIVWSKNDARVANDTVYNTYKILRERGVKINVSAIPAFLSENATLHYETGELKREKIYTCENNRIDIKNIKEIRQCLQNAADKLGLPFKDYVLDEYSVRSEYEAYAAYLQRYGGFLIYDNYIHATFTSKGQMVVKYKYSKVIDVKKEDNNGTKTLSAHQILLSNFTSERPCVITGIDLGFKGESDEGESRIIHKKPVWRIRIEGQEPEYYNVFDGKRIK
ncbi:MAG: two-component system regulatory protein YycI [Clostridia bacterium]|nr:two-component system regulatory protein YycI [Clostridia bacterium]